MGFEFKELVGKNCKIIELKTFRTADEEVIYGLILELEDGRRIEIVADDPAGCFNGGGYCLPLLVLRPSDE